MLRRTATIHPVAKRRLVAIFAHKIRAQFSTLLHRRRVHGTRTKCQVRHDIMRVFVIRVVSRRAPVCFRAFSQRSRLTENQRSNLGFRETSGADRIDTRTSNLIYLVKSTFGTSNLELVRNLNREIEKTKQDTALTPI